MAGPARARPALARAGSVACAACGPDTTATGEGNAACAPCGDGAAPADDPPPPPPPPGAPPAAKRAAHRLTSRHAAMRLTDPHLFDVKAEDRTLLHDSFASMGYYRQWKFVA